MQTSRDDWVHESRELEFVKAQLDRLADARRMFGLTDADQLEYDRLAELERGLIDLRDATLHKGRVAPRLVSVRPSS